MKQSNNTHNDVKISANTSKHSPRTLGVFMIAASIIIIGWQGLELYRYIEDMRALPGSMRPDKMFVNIYKINGAPFSLVVISSLLVILILGIFRVVKNKKSKDLIYIAIVLAFGLAIGGTSQLDSIAHGVEEELLVVQKDWAEKRYGISYDEITVKKTKGNKNRTKLAQDSVIKNGETIATVCKHDNYNVQFCKSGTDTELPVRFADES